ncbi:MAG: hypoxanthine phosphoribosyltransferase [Chlamydiales bacterium]
MLCRLLSVFFILSTHVFSYDALTDRLHLGDFEVLLSEKQIAARVEAAGEELCATLRAEGIEEVTILALMKGAICIAADLMRSMDMHTKLECIQTKSYGSNGKVRGELQIIGLEHLDLKGKHVMVVDDIFDSGNTLSEVMKSVALKNPATLRSVIFLNKDAPRATDYRPDYSLFEIENRFVVGYGMDYKELWRNLREVRSVE